MNTRLDEYNNKVLKSWRELMTTVEMIDEDADQHGDLHDLPTLYLQVQQLWQQYHHLGGLTDAAYGTGDTIDGS